MRLIILAGRSGAGKNLALHILEEHGFYCLQGLPFTMLPNLVEQLEPNYDQVAVGIDTRSVPQDSHVFENTLQQLQDITASYETVLLQADDATLLQRFSETRRKHPLTNENTSLQEALEQESTLLSPLVDAADIRIDTNRLTINGLRESLQQRIIQRKPDQTSILLQSFGFKFGVPMNSDYLFDVRCLPNPYWEPGLRHLTGMDSEVHAFMQQQENTTKLEQQIKDFLNQWIPIFAAENRHYITVSIGCTGGQHRSVYMVECMAKFFAEQWGNLQIRHRELS